MKVDNKNGIGNPYHNDNTGEFSSAGNVAIFGRNNIYEQEENPFEPKEKKYNYINHLDEDVSMILENNQIPEQYINSGDMKCSKSAAYNLLKAYNDDNVKNIKLCMGELQDPKINNLKNNAISHMWVEVDGNVLATREPSYAIRKEKDSLTIDKNKNLKKQVQDFLSGKDNPFEYQEDKDDDENPYK